MEIKCYAILFSSVQENASFFFSLLIYQMFAEISLYASGFCIFICAFSCLLSVIGMYYFHSWNKTINYF